MNVIELINQEIEEFPENLIPSYDRSLPLTIGDNVVWVNKNRLTTGNEKLVNIWIFDTPAGSIEVAGSCLNSSTCEHDCYAKQQQLQYRWVRLFRLINLYMLMHDRELLLHRIEKQMKLALKKIDTFRIHSSGDFYEQSEITFWDEFIQNHPELKFYAYTKVDKILDFDRIESNDNFNLIPSMIEHNGVRHRNFGRMDYVLRIAEKTNGFLCPATMPETKGTIKCNKGCTYCVTEKKPIFLIHGKGLYVRKKKKAVAVA